MFRRISPGGVLAAAIMVASVATPVLAAPALETPALVSSAERKAVLAAIIEALRKGYVFPEKVDAIAAALNAQEASGAYARLTDPAAFSEALTADLRRIGKDRHLGVDPVRPRDRAAGPPTPEMIAARDRWAARLNFAMPKAEVLDGNVGYLKIEGFMPAAVAGPVFDSAMAFLSRTQALIFDLRGNHGGDPDMVQRAVSHLLPPQTHINDIYRRASGETEQRWTLPDFSARRYPDSRPVYVLTDAETVSAGEEFAYDLQQLKRATVVGAATAGGANPGGPVPVTQRFELFVPTGRAINPVSRTNWEGVGVQPDVAVAADAALDKARRLALTAIAANAAAPDDRDAAREVLDKLFSASAK